MRLTVALIALLLAPLLPLRAGLAAFEQVRPDAAARDRLLEQAAADLQAGRRADAKQRLTEAGERFESVRALMQLARLQSGEGDAAAALATLEQARTLAPDAEEVLSAIGQVSLAARRPVQALLALEPLTRIAPYAARHQYLFGVALMQAGDMPTAAEALHEAQRLDPADSHTGVALGIALVNRKMFEEAAAVLQRVLDREPDNVEALAAMAEAEEGLGKLDAAHTHATRVLAASPDHPTAHLVLGMTLMKRAEFGQARAALERAAAADAAAPKVFYQLSLACARLGDADAASRYLAEYQRKLRATEARIEELRQIGLPARNGSSR